MISKIWNEAPREQAKKLVSSKVADWFAEYEKNGEILVRIVMNADEYAALILSMGSEIEILSSEEILEGNGGSSSLKMGRIWTADVFATRDSVEWIELLGDKGTKIQKI